MYFNHNLEVKPILISFIYYIYNNLKIYFFKSSCLIKSSCITPQISYHYCLAQQHRNLVL